MSRNFKRVLFKPKNPEKYRGDVNNIVSRSSWETHFMRYCDTNSAVLEYSSEEIIVPYYFALDEKMHRYFPDFLIRVRKADGSIETLLIEIKPRSQIQKPRCKKLTESNKEKIETWLKNQAKWKAAEIYASQRGWKFVVMDEYDLGIATCKKKK